MGNLKPIGDLLQKANRPLSRYLTVLHINEKQKKIQKVIGTSHTAKILCQSSRVGNYTKSPLRSEKICALILVKKCVTSTIDNALKRRALSLCKSKCFSDFVFQLEL